MPKWVCVVLCDQEVAIETFFRQDSIIHLCHVAQLFEVFLTIFEVGLNFGGEGVDEPTCFLLRSFFLAVPLNTEGNQNT